MLQNTTLLTPNRRLAATYLKKFNNEQAALGKTCWPTLDILPIQSWLQRLWYDYTATHIGNTALLLTPHQERILWEEILRQSPLAEGLLQLSATAELAKSAWDLLQQWQIPLTHPALETTENSRALLQWATEFAKRCARHHWLDHARLTDVLSEKIILKEISLPKKIILWGFTEFSPQQKKFFSLCEQTGTKIKYEDLPSDTSSAQRVALTSEKDEITAMARWAKLLLETHQLRAFPCDEERCDQDAGKHRVQGCTLPRRMGKPLVDEFLTTPVPRESKLPHLDELKIACIIPNLENKRETVLQIFSEVFSPPDSYTLDPTTLPFNLSAGKMLGTYPIIHAALQFLNLRPTKMALETVSLLLRSPFLGESDDEKIQRAQFENRLRHANHATLSLADLIDPKQSLNLNSHCPALAQRIKKYLNLLTQAHENKTILPSQWATIYLELLSTLGWPGQRDINSHEYQMVQRWLEAMQEFQALDPILGAQSYTHALHYLIQIMANTVYQPQSPEAPIQILGVLEAAGLPFDHVWMLGLDDTAWPPTAKPNPLIPLALQRTLRMPHATAEREFEYSARLMMQLKNSAKNLIFSHALKNSESDLRPSPLITDLTEITLEQVSLSDFISPANTIFKSHKLETIIDEQAPALLPQEKIQGGVSIFKQQAACPFKAFAEIRLRARHIDTPTAGLSKKDRGTLIHKALELLWQRLKNSDYLHSLPTSELKIVIQNCAEQAILSVTQTQIHESRYLQIELQRLETLLFNWLQAEKLRSPFSVIQQEQEIQATIGKIPITLRMDRIDQLTDGSKLIIDYKTGKDIRVDQWFGDRPEEPQLPLYCVIDPHQVTALAFAKVRTDKVELQGVSAKDIGIPTVKPLKEKSWEQQLAEWQSVLERLADNFAQGYAAVDPKDPNKTCRYCHLKAVCRIYE